MIVIKYGGHALPRAGTPDAILKAVADFHNAEKKVVLVHGGGPQINTELELHGIKSEMVGGYRLTTPDVFEVVQKVLSGQVLRTLVNQLISYGANAVGLSAGDGAIVRAEKMEPIVNGKAIDIGLVGDTSTTDPKLLNVLLDSGFLPVISPVAVSQTGQGLNLNGDLAAGAVGGALKADEVIFMTDVAGIYRDYPNVDSIIQIISASELKELQPMFAAGMIPKVKAALAALSAGAKQVRVIDGRDHQNLVKALEGRGGTVVVP
jgi:acetylglutamate kinase